MEHASFAPTEAPLAEAPAPRVQGRSPGALLEFEKTVFSRRENGLFALVPAPGRREKIPRREQEETGKSSVGKIFGQELYL